MRLSDLIAQKSIFPYSTASFNKDDNKNQLIASCAKLALQAENQLHLADHAIDILYEREKSMSTGIGEGVAIPHATSDQIDSTVTALFTFPAGIDFDSVDGKPVFIVVLMLVPKNQLQHQIMALSAIARMGMNAELKEKIIHSNESKAIWDLIVDSEVER